MRKRTTAVLFSLLAIGVTALPVAAATPKLPGNVGPGYTISLKKPTKPGKYTVVVTDRSDEHNFHLRRVAGGINVKTGVAAKGTRSFTLQLAKGKYTFVCDPHSDRMKGSFTIR